MVWKVTGLEYRSCECKWVSSCGTVMVVKVMNNWNRDQRLCFEAGTSGGLTQGWRLHLGEHQSLVGGLLVHQELVAMQTRLLWRGRGGIVYRRKEKPSLLRKTRTFISYSIWQRVRWRYYPFGCAVSGPEMKRTRQSGSPHVPSPQWSSLLGQEQQRSELQGVKSPMGVQV